MKIVTAIFSAGESGTFEDVIFETEENINIVETEDTLNIRLEDNTKLPFAIVRKQHLLYLIVEEGNA